MNTNRLLRFILERQMIYERKNQGLLRPWTRDKILQSYRFCNVYRELDTVTQWISKNWLQPNKDRADVWFAMCVARLVNWPGTLEALIFPVPWDHEHFIEVLEDRKKRGEKVFTGAYMIHAGPDNISKARYLSAEVLTPLWHDRHELRPTQNDSLASYYKRLHSYKDMGSFMTGQVIADLKYVNPLLKAKDWWTWAISGPGSLRGMNRILGRPVKDRCLKEADWKKNLDKLREKINPLIHQAGFPQLHAQDMQNCLCEFDKYERVRLGEGRPRALYDGATEQLRFPRS